MHDILSKCGMACSRCPSYRDNLQTEADRQCCSAGWARYHAIRLSPDKLRPCDGCQAPDDEHPVRYLNCYVRKCALQNGVKTCAHCSAYPCEDVPRVSLSADDREQIASRLGSVIPDEDYRTFIEPYEGMLHLAGLRASLSPADIRQMTAVSAMPRTVPFPDGIGIPVEERHALERLHKIFSTLACAEGISYARQTRLARQRTYLLKLLWTFGLHGQIEEDGQALVIAGGTYREQGLHSSYQTLTEHLDDLGSYGLHGEHRAHQEDGWLTPTGALRGHGWSLRLTAGGSAGGWQMLEALQTYASRLHERYGARAYRYFAAADMRIFVD